MKLIVGLGNIGRQYKDTPHNAGFEFVHSLRKKFQEMGYTVDDWKNENTFFSELCKVRKDGEVVYILSKPTTYMNLSGKAVQRLCEKFDFDDIVIVHDDLDINLGEYKIHRGKGPKDHNGIKSLVNVKGQENFLRVRLGVENRGETRIPGDIYVIKKLSSKQIELLNEVIYDSTLELVNQI